MSERFLFRHFFDVLALGGALAEWTLACWLLGVPRHAALHVAAPLFLAMLNRAAARPLEREPATGPFAGTPGRVVLAAAFGALACCAVLGVLATGWGAVRLLGALTAEAGVASLAVREPLFGPEFQWLASLALAAVIGLVADGYVRGHRRITVTRIALPVAGLPPAFAGMRIVHVSDFHLGPLADRVALREAIDRVSALDPDVICVTGDVIDTPAADLTGWIPELTRIRAREGVFAILGNHDRRAGAERVAAAIRAGTTWRVLRDDVATIRRGDARLHVAGLEDRPEPHEADGLSALLERVPRGDRVILLAHRPSVFPTAVAAGVPAVLAGHTHGGQLAVPGLRHLNVARLLHGPFDTGTFRRHRSVLHVNRGLGTSGQRIRIGAPREISVVTLVAAATTPR